MTKKSILNIGVVGAGSMTIKRHLPALIKLQEEGVCRVLEICDIDIDAAKKAADKFGIKSATHDADVLVKRKDIDAVCLFGPAEVHYKYGLLALKQGKHIFVEKPPARTLKQVIEMSDLAKSMNLVAVAGLNRRFQKNILHIKQSIAPEAVRTAEAFFHKANSGVEAPFGMRSWLGVSAIHSIDVLCFLMRGKPSEIHVMGNGGEGEVAENFSALIKWGDRHAVFSSNNSSGARKERYAFHGNGVSYVAEGANLEVQYASGKKEVFENTADSSGGIYEEFASFFEVIAGNESPVNTLDAVAPSMHIMELIEDGYCGQIDWSVLNVKQASVIAQTEKEINLRGLATIEKPSILILNSGVLKEQLVNLSQDYTLVYEDDLDDLNDEEKKQVVAIVTGGPGAAPATTKMFKELPFVSVLCVVGASVKKWGGEEATKSGVSVINTADVYAEAVAEFVLMQALLGLRKASASHDAMRAGGWEYRVESESAKLQRIVRAFVISLVPKTFKKNLQFLKKVSPAPVVPKNYKTQTLSGRKIGMLGYGEITKKAIPLFKSFGCDVMVYSEHLSAEESNRLGVRSASLHEVLEADVVSMHRGLSKRTEKSFGAQEINTMKTGSVFINAGRAGLVDTKALVTRLKREDMFACLDVFDQEPMAADDELRKLKNVFLTSHIAGSIKHVEGLSEKSSEVLIKKMRAYLAGNKEVAVGGQLQINNMT